jgi:hypothetical protein
MKMVCAVCMYQNGIYSNSPEAVTIVNGQAVCADHFSSVSDQQTTNGGQVAIFTAGHPYGGLT